MLVSRRDTYALAILTLMVLASVAWSLRASFPGDAIAAALVLGAGLTIPTGRRLRWLGVAARLAGSAAYVVGLAMLGGGDADGYYYIGRDLSTALDQAWNGIGTAGVYFLSAVVQWTLPVSYVGLGWVSGAVLLLCIPRRLPARITPTVFYAYALLSPAVFFWTGAFSKDVFATAAAFLSVGAYADIERQRYAAWAARLAAAAVLALLVRAYLIPLLLIPHVLLVLVSQVTRSRSLAPTPAHRLRLVLVALPLLVFGLAAGVPAALDYASATGSASGIAERLAEAGEANRYGGSAVELSAPERVVAILAPLPFRIRGITDLMAFVDSLLLLLPLSYFWRRARVAGARVSTDMILFSGSVLIIWTIVYSGTGNMGLLVRMKTQIYPFLFLFIAHLAWSSAFPRPRRAIPGGL